MDKCHRRVLSRALSVPFPVTKANVPDRARHAAVPIEEESHRARLVQLLEAQKSELSDLAPLLQTPHPDRGSDALGMPEPLLQIYHTVDSSLHRSVPLRGLLELLEQGRSAVFPD